MRLPWKMRLQDWFADHFGTQYAVPRAKGATKPREPSRLEWFVVEFARTAGIALARAFVLGLILVKALTPQRGEKPVALMFFAAALASLSRMVFSFLL